MAIWTSITISICFLFADLFISYSLSSINFIKDKRRSRSPHLYIDKYLIYRRIANCMLTHIGFWILCRNGRSIPKVWAIAIHSIFLLFLVLGLKANSNNEILGQCIHLFLLHMHSKLNLFSLDLKQLGQGYLDIFSLDLH